MHIRRGKKHGIMYTTLQVAACAVTDDEGLECAGQLVTEAEAAASVSASRIQLTTLSGLTEWLVAD